MPLLEKAKIEAAWKGFNTKFNDAIAKRPSRYKELALIVPSDSPEENYNWLGENPEMREWLDERQYASLKAYKYALANKWFANGIKIKADDIRDDKLGMIGPLIARLADKAEALKDRLIFNLMISGFAGSLGLAYDGQYFFDSDHQDGSETVQSNTSTAALAEASYNTALERMYGIYDANGEPLEIEPSHLIVGPKNRATALALVGVAKGSGGADNVNYQTTKVVVHPRLIGSYANYWFVADLTGELKPFVLQERTPAALVTKGNWTDDEMFESRTFKAGAHVECNAGYGLWQKMFGSTGAS